MGAPQRQMLEPVRDHFDRALKTHGPCARGVIWPSSEGQLDRFAELCRAIDDRAASVIDYGCGYGALADYLRRHDYTGPYRGFDISEDMIAAARSAQAHLDHCSFFSDRERLSPADFTLASGIFNMKRDIDEEDWHAHVRATIHDMASLSRRGFAFNVLTTYVDWRAEDLYYADPLELFDYCKRHISKYVTLLHDSPRWEFALFVRL